MSPIDLADCVFGRWSPQIGDPTIIGWYTVASYLLASTFAFLLVCRHKERHRLFWLYLTALLFALAINKQLDLQSALTAAGRCLAQAQGWYTERRTFQLSFIISIIFTSLLFGSIIVWAMRRELKHLSLAFTGSGILVVFVVSRAVEFHHIDEFTEFEIDNLRVNWMFEIVGITMIGINALYILLRDCRDEKNER